MATNSAGTGDNAPLHAASKDRLTTGEDLSDLASALAERRRNHRRGTLSKISLDPELRAFILARLDTLTFEEITRDVAETFPPARRVSRSSIARWWLANRQFSADIRRSRL